MAAPIPREAPVTMATFEFEIFIVSRRSLTRKLLCSHGVAITHIQKLNDQFRRSRTASRFRWYRGKRWHFCRCSTAEDPPTNPEPIPAHLRRTLRGTLTTARHASNEPHRDRSSSPRRCSRDIGSGHGSRASIECGSIHPKRTLAHLRHNRLGTVLPYAAHREVSAAEFQGDRGAGILKPAFALDSRRV